jgi:hypothetical protein
MRVVERKMLEAVIGRKKRSLGNTQVVYYKEIDMSEVFLFGNPIVVYDHKKKEYTPNLDTCQSDWGATATTMSRLRALGLHCRKKKGIIVFGEEANINRRPWDDNRPTVMTVKLDAEWVERIKGAVDKSRYPDATFASAVSAQKYICHRSYEDRLSKDLKKKLAVLKLADKEVLVDGIGMRCERWLGEQVFIMFV